MSAPDIASYDHFLVGFSGGKDSIASVLALLAAGADPAKIELWHQCIDGHGRPRPGVFPTVFMDWPCTPGYCVAVAAALGLPLYFSWKRGGFLGEMRRDNQPTAPTFFETPGGEIVSIGGKGKNGTRLMYPQPSGDLSVRWCSSYLKIDVMAAAIRNQARFQNARTLVITGERAEESPKREKYAMFETHRSTASTRHVDHWRPVHAWKTAEVWAALQSACILAHPAYRMGWGRVSCACCIFGSANQWASIQAVNPMQFDRVAHYERLQNHTIKRGETVLQLAGRGTPYAAITPELITEALDPHWNNRVIVDPWLMPAGAFAESTGPT